MFVGQFETIGIKDRDKRTGNALEVLVRELTARVR
jgi:hypothetical protein